MPPEIQINSEKLNEKWKFGVSDNGIGIAPEHFERVLISFNVYTSTRKNMKEMESGLPIAKK